MSTDQSGEKRSFFGRLKERLTKTRGSLAGGVKAVFRGRSKIDDQVYDELEEVLIQADLGVDTTLGVIERMRAVAKVRRLAAPDELFDVLRAELAELLGQGEHSVSFHADERPHVTLVAGINGSGKTTPGGKLAHRLKAEGKSVLRGAGDTFRAAAVEQLAIWADRIGVPIIKHQEGADPASVAYDATDAGISRGVDCVIIDTAGRLHTKVNLMEELRKVKRVVQKRHPGAPHEILLVLDATTGQNGLQQARQFTEALGVTGIVLTKLDGTAKGGIAIAIQKELGIPIKFIGVGESSEDLQPFNPQDFVRALLED